MEHKPLIERLWGIVRTHSFAAFESLLHEACPDGSLKALASTLRHLATVGQHTLAQDLLSESLRNHAASPQILRRLEMLLLLGQSGTGKDRGSIQDLATIKGKLQELLLADRQDEAIRQVSEAAEASASPELYELLGRLYVRRGAEQTTIAPTVSATRPEEPVRRVAPQAGAEPATAEQASPSKPREAAVPMATAPLTEKAERAPEVPCSDAAVEALAAKVESPRPAAPSAASSTAGLASARAGGLPPAAPKPPAESIEKARSEAAAPAQWVTEELLKARARAQASLLKGDESRRGDAAPGASRTVISATPTIAAAKPEAAPVELPAPDEPKEQVFARLREAFAKLGKIERKVLAWIMAHPNQNAAQIAKSTELSSAEVTNALKGLTGLWLDPFTFAGYSVRDYVLECMSMGKPAPTTARQAKPASPTPAPRATVQASVQVTETLRAPSQALKTQAIPAAPKPARPAAAVPAASGRMAGLNGLDRRVLEYIGSHPDCTPDEVMEAMGPDEPASVALVSLRREWLDRDVQGRYRIKPEMLGRLTSGEQPEPPVEETTAQDEVAPAPRPSKPSLVMEKPPVSSMTSGPSTIKPPAKEEARLSRLTKGQRQILDFLYESGQARSKEIARALDQEVATVNNALLGPLAGFVSVMHSFWRLNDEIRPALAPAGLAEAAGA